MNYQAFGPLVIASVVACGSPDTSPPDNEALATSRPLERAFPLSPQEVARRSMKSTVVLTMQDQQAQPVSLGTGFFVSDRVIVTNAHVIAGAWTGSVKPLGGQSSHPILGVVALDQSHDLALLEIETNRPPLRLSTSGLPEIGERIFALGNPEGLEGTFSAGIISAHRSFEGDTLLQLTAPISPGSSGGPILDASGDVVGVAVATFREGQNLNFAVPSKWVTTLLTEPRETRPLRSVSIAERPRSSPWNGIGVAAVLGENFQWEGPFDFQSRYTFSLRNRSTDNISDVYCLVVFYDRNGQPLESDWVYHSGVISAGLAERVSGNVDPSVKRLTTSQEAYLQFKYQPETRLEYRVLKYTIVQ